MNMERTARRRLVRDAMFVHCIFTPRGIQKHLEQLGHSPPPSVNTIAQDVKDLRDVAADGLDGLQTGGRQLHIQHILHGIAQDMQDVRQDIQNLKAPPPDAPAPEDVKAAIELMVKADMGKTAEYMAAALEAHNSKDMQAPRFKAYRMLEALENRFLLITYRDAPPPDGIRERVKPGDADADTSIAMLNMPQYRTLDVPSRAAHVIRTHPPAADPQDTDAAPPGPKN